jgi:hypothetical protein
MSGRGTYRALLLARLGVIAQDVTEPLADLPLAAAVANDGITAKTGGVGLLAACRSLASGKASLVTC